MAKKARAAKKAKRAKRSTRAGAKKASPKKAKVLARAAKRTKAPSRKKASATKPRRKTAAPKKANVAAVTPPAVDNQPAAPASTPRARESLSHRIGSAIKAVVDTLSEAEQLHRRLDPDPSKDPAPE